MQLTFVRPKVMINLVAGMLGLLFDQIEGAQPVPAPEPDSSDPKDDDLTKISGLSEWQGDPDDWINQAQTLGTN